MRLEEVFDKLCQAARRALERPGEPVPIDGFPGYMIEFIPEDAERGLLIPGLYVPPRPEKPRDSFDVGYGMDIARMCGLDYVLRKNCTLDKEDVELLVKLYRRGWYAKIWRPDAPDCWAELVEEPEESNGKSKGD
ncbi:MAG: hypothetical protein GSR84_05695 [Desulfurococcales archaeon]|nr:hypothetical protein [Desulfurococcales archaeon]